MIQTLFIHSLILLYCKEEGTKQTGNEIWHWIWIIQSALKIEYAIQYDHTPYTLSKTVQKYKRVTQIIRHIDKEQYKGNSTQIDTIQRKKVRGKKKIT